jgi:phage terminase large subunit-like protein
MNKDNPIYAYYDGLNNGKFIVGKWIRYIYEYLVKGLEQGSFFYNADKADKAIDYIENHCFHTEGELAPGTITLELWQKAMISSIFGIVDKDGRRQFREVNLVVARKNGKSLLASAIAKYEWLMEGGYGARVYCLAPKLDQADIIYNNVWAMTQLDPEWKAIKEEIEAKREDRRAVDDSALARHRMTDLFMPATNSTVKKIAFSAKKSDGFNPSLCICDEIASWEGDKGLKQYEVMKSGMGARPEGILLSCSTSGYINDSIYDELFKRSTRFLLGDSKETKLLPFLYTIDDAEAWNDINELKKSNPNLGVSIPESYMLEEIAIAEGSPSKKSEFLTKYCNIKQNSSLAWLKAEDIEKACKKEIHIEDFKHCYAVAGIDLSQTTDLTACVVVIEKEGELYVFGKAWLPAEKIQEATERDGLPYQIYIQQGLMATSGENFVDYRDCYDWLVNLVEEYEILPLQVGYDRYSANYLINDLKVYGFQCDDVYQGEQLYPILQEFEGMLKDGVIHIGNNSLMKVHMLNSAIKMSVERGRGKLIKLNPTDHIDLVAALIDAMTVRQKWFAEIGEQLRNED